MSVVCTLMFSGAAFSFAATLLQETQKKLAVEAAAINAAGFAGEATAGEAPKSISDSKSGAVETKDETKTTSLSNVSRVVSVRQSSTTIPNVLAEQFGIPNNEPGRAARAVSLKTGEGRARTGIYVYERKDGTIDIILAVVAPTKEEGALYYHTSTNGDLIKAAHANGRMVTLSNNDAQKDFEVQRAFWIDWASRNPPPAVASTDNSSSGGSSSGGGR